MLDVLGYLLYSFLEILRKSSEGIKNDEMSIHKNDEKKQHYMAYCTKSNSW